MADEETTTADDTQETGTGQEGSRETGSGDLGDAGKKALAEERKARREAEKARKALQDEIAELRASMQQSTDEQAAKAEADRLRREAEQAATAKANERILAAEIRAAAAGKLADPSDALRYLDAKEFDVAEDGSVDQQEIADAISGLIKDKPYLAAKAQGFQGSGDGGARGDRGPKQVSEAELKTMSPEAIVKARQEGRLASVMGG